MYGFGARALPPKPYEATASRLISNASATDEIATAPTTVSEKRSRFPSNPLIAAPASGSRGTNQMYRYISGSRQLPLQKVDVVDPDRFSVSVQGEDDAKP